jgi:threonine/homoserine/homoserine lactone efflux protein
VDPWLYLRGVVIGFAVAFALGPVGLLVIRRTIDHGWAHGFVSGLGVATADAAYAAIAAFGLTALTSVLVGLDRLLGIVGGAVLVVMAARGLRAAARAGTTPAADAPAKAAGAPATSGPRGSRAGAWASMVGLTLTNPATILSFTALFASIGAGTGGAAGAALVVAGVFTGSAAWWAILTAMVAGLRARVTPTAVRGLNIAASCVIGAFGVGAVAVGLAAGA